MKEEIFFKNGSKTACLFPIWSRERKNLPKRSFYMPLLFWLAKCPLQESVVCIEEKYPAFVFKWGFVVEFWCEKRNISFSA